MTSLSSAPGTADGASGTSKATASRAAAIRCMNVSFLTSDLEDRHAIATDERTQQQDGADHDDEDEGAERAGHARIPILDLVEDRHRAQVEAGKDQEDDRADGHHAVDEEIDEDREGGPGQQRQHDAHERPHAAGAEADRRLLDGRVDLLE